MFMLRFRVLLAALVLGASLTAGGALSAVAQGSIDPDDAEEAWVVAAVIYCNAMARREPWMVPFDPTCQELIAMGLIAAGRFILPSPVE